VREQNFLVGGPGGPVEYEPKKIKAWHTKLGYWAAYGAMTQPVFLAGVSGIDEVRERSHAAMKYSVRLVYRKWFDVVLPVKLLATGLAESRRTRARPKMWLLQREVKNSAD
jgi:hypothetical protein